jgi:hypothetical protein
MARPRKVQNTTLLNAALEGLEIQKERIEGQLREVRAMLGHRGPGRAKRTATAAGAGSEKPARKRRSLSAAARKRIAAAQKARWAKFRKANPAPEA